MIEYFVKEYIFKNLKPELVEKKDPPIITKIKNIKDKFLGLLSNEKPIFDTLLVIAKTKFVKFSLPPSKGACKIVDADNPSELVRLLREEAKII